MTKFYNNLAGKVKLVKRHYLGTTMDFDKLPAEPYSMLSVWLEEALGNNSIKEPNAMCLTTAGKDGSPHSRMVLLKDVYPEPAAGTGAEDGAAKAGAAKHNKDAQQPAGLVFFSNYNSDKGKQISANPKVALTIWWPPLYKQVRVEGVAQKLAAELSDEYFASRDRGSQIGAWASPQSSRLENYRQLQQSVDDAQQKFKDKEVPRPANWGGYLVVPHRVEFWEGRISRLHYRVVYQKRNGANQSGGAGGAAKPCWDKFMLAP